MATALRLVALVLALLASAPAAASVPSDEAGFTAYVAGALAAALPEARVSAGGLLRLTVDRPPLSVELQLDEPLARCRQDAAGCDAVVRDFVRRNAEALAETADPVRPEQLRAVVRTAAHVEEARRLAGGLDVGQPVARPLAGDLWLLCVVDHPHGIKTLTVGDAAKLGLTEEAAIALAERNVAAALPPPGPALGEPPRHGVAVLDGDFYASSRLLLHDQWQALAHRLHGRLVVAAVAADTLIYGDGRDSGAIREIAAAAVARGAQAQRPISPTLLRWLPGGWEVVTP
jgi:hypothetical protein